MRAKALDLATAMSTKLIARSIVFQVNNFWMRINVDEYMYICHVIGSLWVLSLMALSELLLST